MDIMTKVRVLWDKVAELVTQETATAATLARILPRIPADYSETETATGQKWIDGKDIYKRVISDALPVIDSTYNHSISVSDFRFETVVSLTCITRSLGGNTQSARFLASALKQSQTININSITSGYTEGTVSVTVFYTKPDPVPAQVDKGTGMITGEDPEPETKKRKTTKKEEK